MPEPSDDAPAGAAPAAPPTDTEPVPTDEERAAAQKEVDDEIRRGRVELLAAVLLGLAGALTAFSAYKAALTDGDALAGYTMSSKSTSDANSFYDDYSQTYLSDQQMFLEFNLAAVEDPELAAEIRERYFSPELEAATQVWAELPDEDTPPTPLDLDEYVVESYTSYEETAALADEQFEEGATADAAGDKFELANVYFAVALFMAGVAALFRKHPVRYFALALSVVAMVPGIVAMVQGQNALG
ncbi:DUF4337 domain-containing protein [Iamia sp. SCSIO 61187]|uniref:DUF4337 family protein n=1 Tax=Iamia sp. SCSIO 61187 TaxID=2722752 RepID=UPI001C6288C1|nr:DUF4337 family protein [Iamia sp. SCSIO 61187]QYG92423.1 DUF4337 domain-containing protein [Iamia sp. SCSIO 61187]